MGRQIVASNSIAPPGVPAFALCGFAGGAGRVVRWMAPKTTLGAERPLHWRRACAKALHAVGAAA